MSRLSRRGMMGSVVALIPTAAVATSAAASPLPHWDAELMALVRRWHEIEHEVRVQPIFANAREDDAWCRTRFDAQHEVFTTIRDIRPRTIEGRMAKATVALATFESMNEGLELDELEQFIMAVLREATGRTSSVTGGTA